jgi:hypothetical protein
MNLKELVTNNEGVLSHSKIWANIAYAAGTVKFIMLPDPSSDIWMAYLGIVGGAAVASKLIQMKFGTSNTSGDSK